MTEKEKAKAYDKAIERAKKLYSNGIAEEIFPELKESEDEKIKKAIIEFFESEDDNTTYSLAQKKDIIAWLENQGKKYTDKNKPRFNVGDWIVDKFGDSWHIDSLDKKNYQVYDGEGNYNYFPISKQDEMHLWTIQDAKDGDIIHFGTVTGIFKKYIGREKCICYCSFCKDGGFEIPIENGDDNVYGCYNATPATKEQRNVLIKAMNDAGYKLITFK